MFNPEQYNQFVIVYAKHVDTENPDKMFSLYILFFTHFHTNYLQSAQPARNASH